MLPQNPFGDALSRILRPLVRVMIARGMAFPEFAGRVKELYVEVCNRHFRLEAKRLTDSRISLLTGLQRKDIRLVRTRLETTDGDAEPQGAGPLPRILARWMGGAPYTGQTGAPRSLPRSGAEGVSFETLAAEVSRDIHPRTVLDELIRLGLVEQSDDDGRVSLIAPAYLPSGDDAALLGYFGANLGDHAEAAATNLLAAPKPGPFFERSVHYNQLTPEALAELDTMARQLQGAALLELNNRALELQQRDDGNDAATGRFRCGAYIFRSIGDASKGED
ncbi:MAG TPA: DUF6502 family protein [Thermohalobaculum sp.]|nr:DUF6502 family protein [Thermohalobaculum sp.]